MRKPSTAVTPPLLFLAAFAPYAAAQCDGRWVFSPEQQAYPTWGVNNGVSATLIWDPDDAGPQPPQMVIGGAFDKVEGDFAPLLRAARWDGHRWVQLGGGLNNQVSSMCLWDPDGPGPLSRQILAVGLFTTADGLPAPRAARWDGSAWHALPGPSPALSGGIPGSVTAWDPDGPGPQPEQPIAVVTISSGSPRTSYIARHDGTEWVRMGPDFNSTVERVFSWDADGAGPQLPVLLAAGDFTMQDITPLNRIARWDGSQWVAYAGGANGRVLTLGAWNSGSEASGPSKLVAAGYFTGIGGTTIARSIAVWDGAAWSALGSGLDASGSLPNPYPTDVASFDPDGSGPLSPELIAVGLFTGAGGATARGVAIWNGSSWRELSGGLVRQTSPSGWVSPTNVAAGDLNGDNSGDTILVGGSFFSSGGVDGIPSMTSPRVAVSDGDTWLRLFTSLVGPVYTSPAHTATSWDPDGPGPARSRLVLAGDFTAIADTTAGGVVSWDGAEWIRFGSGISRIVRGLTQLDPPNDLIAAGTSSASVAYLDGDTWRPFEPNPWGGADIDSVTTWDPDGTGPMPAGPVAAGDRIVRYYNGTSWQQVGPQFSHAIFAIGAVDHDGDGPAPATLYCGGEFFGSGYINYWDGSSWQPLAAGGANGPVNALKSWDPDGAGPQLPRLIAGGLFASAGGVTTGAIASWNGSAWQALGSGLTGQVRGLTTWDPDGPGPKPIEVVAMGTFAVSGSSNIARWNGSAWLPMGIGVNGQAYGGGAFELNGPGTAPVELIIGGNFTAAGGVNSRYFARWTETGAPWIARHPLPADLTAGDAATFSIAPAPGYDFDAPLMYQWRRNGEPISDGPSGASAGGGAVSGSQTATLVITGALPPDAGSYDCLVSNGCGSATSDAAALTLGGSCPADLTGDGLIDFSDYLEFLNLFDAGDPRVDFNQDGIVDFSDYLEFLNHFDAGC